MQEFVVYANGVRHKVRMEGSGPALILLHGVGRWLEIWGDVAQSLCNEYTVIRYDLRGHGDSEKVSGPYELDDFVEDLNELLSELGIERASLVGFSLGGLIAQGFTLKYPERVNALCLVSTVAGRNRAEQERVNERLDRVMREPPSEHFTHSVERWFSEEFRANNPSKIAELTAAHARNDKETYAAAYRVLAKSDLADELYKIGVPTLIMTGSEDRGSNPRMAKLMADRIPGAKLDILDGLRHSVVVEAPDLIATKIREFLDRSLQRTGDP